jgi:predicted DsbA family dithiol-disulfide isomerase
MLLLCFLVVHVAYLTDPLCPWSWAAEPQLRRLQVEFGDSVAITYVMVGMAREVDAGQELAATLAAVAESGMPADPRVWLDGAPRSSYPACMAVKAAADQGLDGPYLRRLREGVMCRRERVDNVEAFLVAARDVPGMRVDRFEIDLRSNAIVEAFGADRERAGAGDRPAIPALVVEGGEPLTDSATWRDAVIAAGAEPGSLPDPAASLRRFGAMGAAEVAAVCDLPAERARMELWRLAGEFQARPRRLVCGELWEHA